MATKKKHQQTNKPVTALQNECEYSTKMQTHRLPLKINFKALLVYTQSTFLLANKNNNNNDDYGNARLQQSEFNNNRKSDIRDVHECGTPNSKS